MFAVFIFRWEELIKTSAGCQKPFPAMVPMVGGILMIAASYVVSSWLLMSLLSTALMVAVYLLVKRGY
jgi:hypothetical protein